MEGKQVNASSPRRPGNRGGGPVIGQALLAAYEEVAEACRRKEERKAKLRERIVALLERGAAVEPGPLDASVAFTEQVFCSWRRLAAVFGPEWVESARGRIEPTLVRRLKVARREGGAVARKPRPARRGEPGHFGPRDLL